MKYNFIPIFYIFLKLIILLIIYKIIIIIYNYGYCYAALSQFLHIFML